MQLLGAATAAPRRCVVCEAGVQVNGRVVRRTKIIARASASDVSPMRRLVQSSASMVAAREIRSRVAVHRRSKARRCVGAL